MYKTAVRFSQQQARLNAMFDRMDPGKKRDWDKKGPRRGGLPLAVRTAIRRDGPVTGCVLGRNAGGLVVDVAGVRGFCPFTHMSLDRREPPQSFQDRHIQFLVIGTRDDRLVLSRRRLLERQRARRFDVLRRCVGRAAPVIGTILRVESYGAFVDLDDHVIGMLHVSQLSDHYVADARSLITGVGHHLRVRVLDVDEGAGRVRLTRWDSGRYEEGTG